ncbi:LacI family DNA-binding transcriptional regulator [Catellatospora coxensis]
MTNKRRPTIHDVARASGVSRGTVSRALNGDPYVSTAALAAVRRAVAETGYVVNRAARSLVTQRTGTVVMVLSEPQEKLFEDPNFSVLLRVATRRLAQRDVALVMMVAGDDGDRERVVRYLRGGHADGVLLLSAHSGDPLLAELEGLSIPAVACGAVLGREGVIPYAAADDREGARQMAQYLVDLGRKKIATITGPLDTPAGSTGSKASATCSAARRSRNSSPTATTPATAARPPCASCSTASPTSTPSSSAPT